MWRYKSLHPSSVCFYLTHPSYSSPTAATATWPYRDILTHTSSTSWQPARERESGREGHRMSCMSFSVFNSSQPVTMETVSWGELKTKNAVQIQVAAGVCLSHQRSAGAHSHKAWGGRQELSWKNPGIVGKFALNLLFFLMKCYCSTLCPFDTYGLL